MIRVGVIGVGPQWNARYRPALEALAERVKVVVLHDPLRRRADAEAGRLSAFASPGVVALSRFPRLRAILLSGDLHASLPTCQLLAKSRLPVLWGQPAMSDPAAIVRLAKSADKFETSITPALPLRFAPSTFRAKELIVTRLGAPWELTARLPHSISTDRVAKIIDWCRYLSGRDPVRVWPASGDQPLRYQFARRGSGRTAMLTIECSTETMAASAVQDRWPSLSVRCQRGRAELSSPTDIAWSAGRESRQESLSNDRPAELVLVDHFLRRAAGGLIPSADLKDVRIAARAATGAGLSKPV
ncbi:hypothetical protein [Stratiformator vulcanicus]|uniref:Gfo/Idh/MocA-like oxidoreductase N-terminal domain-containing protein n=1 Tax=Stratiformator vulcanicus TaxID=2527980 RepID=A0A517R4U9_9PLAN|nr:hypothetical protein [Stratiformator vulcanicus]QDT38919.1 hypothetical protein Pan189_33180 [Stratiformator vulcanicus]